VRGTLSKAQQLNHKESVVAASLTTAEERIEVGTESIFSLDKSFSLEYGADIDPNT
jgi:hypothetical protein